MKSKEIDLDRLREELLEECYAGGMNGLPAMLTETWEIEEADEGELIRMARKSGILRKDQ